MQSVRTRIHEIRDGQSSIKLSDLARFGHETSCQSTMVVHKHGTVESVKERRDEGQAKDERKCRSEVLLVDFR
jgi:hypothetical protein